MLRVAQRLLDLDVKFKKGEDIDGVREGYTEALLQAIASQDRLYEVEVLKSLGDVSLQRCRRTKKVEDFLSAIRLYSAALRRCDDTGVKESLEHRKKLADKRVTRLVSQKGQEHDSSNNHDLHEATMSQVSETLCSVDKALYDDRSDFVCVRKLYAGSLVSAIMSNNTLLEVEALKGIGDASLNKGKLTQNTADLADAAGLYRGALSRCEDTDGQEALLHRIGYTEKIKEQISAIQIKAASSEETGMRKPKTRLSTVAGELRELDLMFERGSDLVVVERGYKQKLIYAISTEDEVFECEALKSLGDLYLHKAKANKNKAENFNKACAFYTEVLRFHRSKEEKEIVEHRIKYAEKCTKLVHDQELTKPGIDNSANVTLALSETLYEVENKTKTTGKCVMALYHPPSLIEAYTSLFVEAIADRHKRLEVECLKSLGDVYLEKGRVGKDEAAFTTAAGMYRAALDRCGDSDGRETLNHRVKYTEKVKDKTLNHRIKYTEKVKDKTLNHRIKYAEKVKDRTSKKSQGTGQSGNRKAVNDNESSAPPTSRQASCTVISKNSKQRMGVEQGNAALAKVTNEIQKDADSTYQDQLQEGCRALQTGDLDRAERKFAAALKAVHIKGLSTSQHQKEAEPLTKLSNVYLKRGMQSKDGGDFTKAAALCNAALVRSRTEDRERTKQTIQKISKSFVQHVLSSKHTVDIDDAEKHKLMLKKSRDYVEEEIKRIEEQADPYSLNDDDPEIREVEKKRAEAIKELFETIVYQRRTFIAGLVDECMEVMGPSPCKYAMIGLGSQATGLVTPYSDLEFAILIEEETDNTLEYFRNLTHFLHLKVVNLGETILPAMAIKLLNDFSSDDPLDNWFYDSVTPRGFAFDGAMPHACKTPLGRGKTSELIHTPENMAKVLTDDLTLHLKKGYHLVNILGNVCLITGEQELVDVYTASWTRQLQASNGRIPLVQAFSILSENVPMFTPEGLSSELLNVKKDIYRFSSLAVSCWALFHDIQPTTIWETIEKMHKSEVVNGENAHHLMVLVSISAELRLRTYMNNRGQVENMSALSAISTQTDIGETLKKVFYFSNSKQLMRYYCTARPLQMFILQLAESQPVEGPSVLFDKSSQLQAEVYESLCDYHNSKKCAERALQNNLSRYGDNTTHPDIATSLQIFGIACQKVGDNRKAVNYHEQAIQMYWSIYGENTAHTNIYKSLNCLGAVWMNVGDHRKALGYFEQSLQMCWTLYGQHKAHPDLAATLNNLGDIYLQLGDYGKSVSYFEQSLQMQRSICSDSTAHRTIAIILCNLGTVWRKLGDCRKAVSYYEETLQMQQNIYGENTTHPEIAKILNNLSAAWGDLGDQRKAIKYCQQSLMMRWRIYGENTAHPEIAWSLHNLGAIWANLGDDRKAVSYYQDALQMRRSIYGHNTPHPDIAALLTNLGNASSNLGDHRRAKSYQEESLQMKQSVYGKNTAHPDIASSLHDLGNTWWYVGDFRKAIRYYQLSLKMKRSIFGKNTPHPDIAASLTNLGKAFSDRGDHRGAMSYLEEALQMRQSVYGKNTAHPDIASSLIILGCAFNKMGDHRKAVNYYERSLQMSQIIHDKNTAHPDIAVALNNLGNAWGDLGDQRKSNSYYEQSLQMWRSICGKNTAHPGIAASLTNLGISSGNLGDHRKAVSYYEQALQMYRSIYGEQTEHPDIAKVLFNLGTAWWNLGDHRKAYSILGEATQMEHAI